jgi:hypothetical protein
MCDSNSLYRVIYNPNFERMELLTPLKNIPTTPPIRQLVAISEIQQIKHPPALPKLVSTSKMFKSKGTTFPSSNDWWGPHHPENHFSSTPTRAGHIKNHLTRAEAVKYYPDGFPKGWEDSPEDLAAQAQEDAAHAKAAEKMIADMTKEKKPRGPRSKKNKTKIEPYMEAVSEDPPATPRLHHAMPVPMDSWPLALPTVKQDTPPATPTHKPRKPRIVHKQALPREKKGSPLRESWVLPESDNSSGENQQA